MPLQPGTRLGPYEVIAAVGAGGMGEVYRASDTDLKRTVAIKVLPQSVAADEDRLARFQRESETLAALNHPHIAQIYRLETVGDAKALVMEFVEGATLGDRIARSPLRLDEALSIARQIAEALEAAHEQGIVHRDLKPANIKIRPDGEVKVLDFGLATRSRVAAVSANTAAATMAAAWAERTEAGAILGTLTYMSPEQARGDVVDRRTDNWAFGCILAEMLTRKPAFAGATAADLISRILGSEPELEQLPSDTPAALRRLIERCLEKDRRNRLQFIGDARVELEHLIDNPAAAGVVRQVQTPSRLAAMAALVVALAIGSVVALQWPPHEAQPPREVRFEVAFESSIPTLKISPDGKQIAYASPSSPGGAGAVIWIRPLDSLTPHVLPGTEGAGLFSWSWDSRSIVFRVGSGGADSRGALKRVDVSGGSPQALAADAGAGAFPVWGREDVILFSGGDGTLRKVSAAGGDVTAVTTPDRSRGEINHLWPMFLPDGRHFVYLAWRNAGPEEDRATLFAASIDGREPPVRLMEAASMAIYAKPGYLLYAAGKSLMARPFDASRLRFTGDAFTVADDVQATTTGRLVADVSDDGTLVYRRTSTASAAPFQWIDRHGTILATVCPLGLGGPKTAWRLSPDDKRVAVFSAAGVDIWLCDLERQQGLRLTNDPPWDRYPIWSQPDGSRILFGSFRSSGNTANALFEKAATGATPERLVVAEEPETVMEPLDWSRDGHWIVFSKAKSRRQQGAAAENRDLWMMPTTGDRIARPYLASPFDEHDAALSPDGRFLAYTSNENGRSNDQDVIVQPFPVASRGKWKISSNGGGCPRWKRDGTELYYVNALRQIVAVSVSTVSDFSPGRQSTLGVTLPGAIDGCEYDVAADGQRFLVAGRQSSQEGTGPGRPMTVVLNWAARFVKR